MEITRKEREKLARENDIVSAAEIVFCKKGFNNASMDEIAKTAQFTKRTVYKYFENKEDLYFAVVLKSYQKLFEHLKRSCKNGDSGFSKLVHLILEYYKFYEDHPEILHLRDYIGYVKKQTSENSERHKSFNTFNDFIFKEFCKLIEEGKNDGSIKKNLDSNMTTYSIIFTITGLLNQLSISGRSYAEHFKLDYEKFVHSSLDIILNSIKNFKEE